MLIDPVLPPGDDERFVGFGIMGLPFSNGHYLAMRQFPATTFAPPYISVWHRDPSCNWTFYATTPGQQSCARFFGSATPNDAVQCDIGVSWAGSWSVLIEIPGLLHWTVELQATTATRLMSSIGGRLSESAWTNPTTLRRLSAVARRTLGVGDVRLDRACAERPVLHDGPETVVDRRRLASGIAGSRSGPRRAVAAASPPR